MGEFTKHAKFISEIKSVDETNGTFEVVASIQNVDRDGDVILIDGIDITNYLKNPVILFGHDYWSLPIGCALEVIKGDGKMIVKGKFASGEANPFAQQVRKLYDEKILFAVSIGFIGKQWEGNLCTACELLEVSFVPVPANADALSVRSFITGVRNHNMQKEFAFAVKSAMKEMQFGAEIENFVKEVETSENSESDTDTPENTETPQETQENAEIGEDTELIKTIKACFAELSVELNENIKNLTNEVVELKGLVVKDKSQTDVTKSEEMVSVLESVHGKAQLIDRIVNQLNAQLKSVRK